MIKIALIGIDTSHTVSYPEVIQGPKRALTGMRAISCLSFMTPFTNQKVIDERTAKLTELGVKVTKNLDEALEGCDAIMLEINDGSYHLEYFRKVAALGKPVFLDKPLACSLADGRAILRLAAKHKTRVWSARQYRFRRMLNMPKNLSRIPVCLTFWTLGIAPSGDSLIWYGVHVVGLMQRLMGPVRSLLVLLKTITELRSWWIMATSGKACWKL